MIDRILDKAVAGERLSPEEGLALIQSHDLAALGRVRPKDGLPLVHPLRQRQP